MLRNLAYAVAGISFALGYATTALAGDIVYQRVDPSIYSRYEPAAGGSNVVETTSYYNATTPQTTMGTDPTAPRVVYYTPRGSTYHRDRYYTVTRQYVVYDDGINRDRGDRTAGENDPMSQKNRLQYKSCPPGQAKRGFC